MKSFKNNLLVQFSALGLFIVVGLAVGVSTLLTDRLNHHVEVLKQHEVAMEKGVMSSAHPYSIAHITEHVRQLQWITYGTLGGGFVILYISLVSIVWRGWRTINRQQATLISRKQAEEALQSRYNELAALHEVGRTILSSPDLNTVLEKILDQALSITSLDIGNVRLFDPSGNMVLGAHRGYQSTENIHLHRLPLKGPDGGMFLPQVITSGKSVVVEDVPASDGLRPLKREKVRSVILVPVSSQKEVLGVIEIGSRTPRSFQPEEVHLLEAVGNQIGIAVQKAHLYGETQRNLERIQALREIDKSITSTLDLNDVLDVLLKKIDILLPYSSVTVRLMDRESGVLEAVACQNIDEKEWKVEQWKNGRGPANAVLEAKAAIRIRDVKTDARIRDPEFFRKQGLVSYLGVPMVIVDEILGVLSFYTKEEHEFSDEEVEFLSTLAGQAAIAIHNSQLYEEIKNLAGDLAMSNRVKDEFLGVMSHELRTPLNIITGFTGMIREGLLGKVNRKQKEALEKVLSQTNDQLGMIDSILQAAQMEVEKVQFESREVSLRSVLDQLRWAYEIPVGKELSLKWDYPSNLPVVETDSEKLKHILQNLINNAIKFTEKGSVTVSARYFAEEKRAEFKVKDTGIGIPEKSLAVIFEKFRQVDSSQTRFYGGMGLGLYIVKKFTELLGGKVEVESKLGKGTTFTVRVPCNSCRSGGAESHKSTGGKTVADRPLAANTLSHDR